MCSSKELLYKLPILSASLLRFNLEMVLKIKKKFFLQFLSLFHRLKQDVGTANRMVLTEKDIHSFTFFPVTKTITNDFC